MNGYIQERYVLFASNYPQSFSAKFCLATIVEEENTNLKRLLELKTSLRQQNILAFIGNSIKKALQIPLHQSSKTEDKRIE